MNYLKELWNSNYVEIRINKRLLFVLLAVYALNFAKNYYFMKGATAAFEFDMKQGGIPTPDKSDDETQNSGHLDHSKDPLQF